ncbi:hypothetical protein IG631_03460 [Alternaria alternata]|nr:hypothetical protein IG631_03460 [Alternaria alternata]
MASHDNGKQVDRQLVSNRLCLYIQISISPRFSTKALLPSTRTLSVVVAAHSTIHNPSSEHSWRFQNDEVRRHSRNLSRTATPKQTLPTSHVQRSGSLDVASLPSLTRYRRTLVFSARPCDGALGEMPKSTSAGSPAHYSAVGSSLIDGFSGISSVLRGGCVAHLRYAGNRIRSCISFHGFSPTD